MQGKLVDEETRITTVEVPGTFVIGALILIAAAAIAVWLMFRHRRK